MKTKIRVRHMNASGEREVVTYSDYAPDDAARLALTFIERWGLVAGIQDGEDSAGRAKLRLLEPDELVERAFTIAEKALTAAHARGHMVEAPDLNELNAKVDVRRDAEIDSKAERDWDVRMRLAEVEHELEVFSSVLRQRGELKQPEPTEQGGTKQDGE